MSGILLVPPATTAGTPPPAPFSLSFVWTGAPVVNVAGASGTCTPSQGLFSIVISGGTPPYGGSGFGVSSNPSGKINYAASSDGVHTTLAWSGFTVNEAETFTATFNATDSASHSITRSTAVAIKRTS